MTLKPIKILLIDDSEADIFFTKHLFKKHNITNQIDAVHDGETAIRFLQENLIKNNLPDIILLDINMPRTNGKDVLNFIKSSDEFKHINVIMLSSSQLKGDVLNTYKLDADGYIMKPIDIDEFYSVIKKMDTFKYTISKIISA